LSFRKDPEKLWKAIVKTHKVKCMGNVNKEMDLVARKAYQKIKMGLFEMLSMYSERYHNTYQSYKATKWI
jgi:hypothetical protein